MITIRGLSKEDMALCDLLWHCDTLFEVENLIAMMPPKMGDRAVVLQQLIIAEELDSYMEVSDAVKDYLSSR
jgi:hypothetical protein